MTVSTARHAKPRASVSREGPSSPAWTVVVALLVVMGVVAALLSHYVVQATEWRVMGDELTYLELSRSIAHTLSPVAMIRGAPVPIYSVLYPLIIAPFVGLLDAPAAFQAIRLVNVAVMVSTAIPAYLLAREASSRAGGVIAATLSVLVPWMTQSTLLMSEVAAYPAFTWAVYAMTRAVAAPSVRRDVIALAAIGVACLARTQFVLLLLAFPVAVLVHEMGRRVARDGPRNIRSIFLGGVGEALRGHLVPAVAVAIGVVLLVFRATVLLGGYDAATTTGSILPAGLPGSAIGHLAYVAVGIGALPLVFGIAFSLGTVGRAVAPRPHALAAVTLVVVVATTLVVASFDLRFGFLGRDIQERYLFYICPPLFAGAVGWFAAARVSLIATAIAALATAGIVVAKRYEPQPQARIEGFASPNRYFFAVLDGRLRAAESNLGLRSPGLAIVIAAICVLLALLAMVLIKRGRARLALATFGISVAAFLAAQLVYVFPKVIVDHNRFAPTLGANRPLAKRNWVDRLASQGAGAVVGPINSESGKPIADPFLDSAAWWELAFWNRSIDQVFRFDDYKIAPLVLGPAGQLSLDFASGALHASAVNQPPRLLLATSDVRFAPAYQGSPVHHGDLTLYRTAVPYRAGWASQGIADDGWTKGGHPAVVRVYGRPGSRTQLSRLRILLHGGADIGKPRRFTIRAAGSSKTRVVRTTTAVHADVCAPAGGHADVTLRVQGSTRLRRRDVGLRVLLIEAGPTRRACRPG